MLPACKIKEVLLLFWFGLSLKQKRKIKGSIYIPSVPIQELYNRAAAVLPSDRDDYLVGIPNSPKRNINTEGLLINTYKKKLGRVEDSCRSQIFTIPTNYSLITTMGESEILWG